jgi:hypothetical protein
MKFTNFYFVQIGIQMLISKILHQVSLKNKTKYIKEVKLNLISRIFY